MKLRRLARNTGVGIVVLALLTLLSFALPVRVWRTGELPAPPLPLVEDGPRVELPAHTWIDTDAACGHTASTDSDDCVAISLLTQAQGVEIIGVSTVHGNAPVEVTDRTARELIALLGRSAPVYRGSSGAIGEDGSAPPAPAHAALQNALAQRALTIVALGPLTNIAAALKDRPELAANVARLVAVMGRRPGHLFHPSEGHGQGILFGHGPVFRDFNVEMDRAAVTIILELEVPITLVPYEAAREIMLTESDIAGMAEQGVAAKWIASRSRGWLDYWRTHVGLNGFYPFDLLAAAYVIEPRHFDCARANAWMGEDDRLWKFWFYNPKLSLLIGLPSERPWEVRASGAVVYCPRIDDQLYPWLKTRFAAPSTS